MTRLLIAAPAQSLSDSAFDGFITRHVALVSRLIDEPDLEVTLLCLGADQSWSQLPSLQGAESLVVFPWMDPPATYFGRLLDLAKRVLRLESRDQERILGAVVESLRPDVAITLGPWYDTQFQAVYSRCPTLHFFEEDVMRLFKRWWGGSLFHRIDIATRRVLPARPAQVAVISDVETQGARRRYGRTPITTVRYTPPRADWPLAAGASDGTDVLVMGALDQERNALGLAELLTALERQGVEHIPFRLVSDQGLHRVLARFLTLPWVTHQRSLRPARSNYDEARLVVVPARRATGVKTTILQAWACGVAVAAFQESAATVSRQGDGRVAAARTPEALARIVVDLWADQEQRQALSLAGLAALRGDFDEDRNYATVHSMVQRLADRRPG